MTDRQWWVLLVAISALVFGGVAWCGATLVSTRRAREAPRVEVDVQGHVIDGP
jgi:hypothetical protein